MRYLTLTVFCIAVSLPALSLTAEETKEKNVKTFVLHPIGVVEKTKEQARLVIDEKCQGGLLGLNGFSHVWVLYWFDRNDTPAKRSILQVHPRGNAKNPLTGVFATRAPVRPNLIALSLCKIVSVKDNVVEIEDIDAFDESPILDIKPYLPRERLTDAKFPDWIGRK